VKEIPDEKLRYLIPFFIEIKGAGSVQQMYLIGHDYHIIRTLTVTDDISRINATKARQQLLQSGRLLATIAVGIVVSDWHAVVEYYPARGQLETYTLTYPEPKAVWTDPDDPESQAAVEFFKETWRLE
jgi:hypothetical protein